ncbi:TcpD family membrane protein [Mammaliicoccus sp. J-M41]|uniref:TcpD family membrane protein n=1 Tax=Mammaliicoccus sp. J-M41 TaxID=2898700 RepID=UPI001EFBCE95|nr:TcpD family membrane protein [Mammaliicoccus sp. J-M41]
MLNILNSLFVLGAAKPTIGGVGDWLTSEVGTGIGVIVLIIGVGHWIAGKYGKMVALFLVGGLMFFISKGPERVFNGISAIWQMIFSSGS